MTLVVRAGREQPVAGENGTGAALGFSSPHDECSELALKEALDPLSRPLDRELSIEWVTNAAHKSNISASTDE